MKLTGEGNKKHMHLAFIVPTVYNYGTGKRHFIF